MSFQPLCTRFPPGILNWAVGCPQPTGGPLGAVWNTAHPALQLWVCPCPRGAQTVSSQGEPCPPRAAPGPAHRTEVHLMQNCVRWEVRAPEGFSRLDFKIR